MRNMKHKNSGFTMIELLVVVAIIGILMAVAAVSYTTLQEKARKTKVLMTAKQLAEAWNLYIQQNGWFPIEKLNQFCTKEDGWYVTDDKFVEFKRYSDRYYDKTSQEQRDTPPLRFAISREEEKTGVRDSWKNPKTNERNHLRFKLDDIRETGGSGMTNKLKHPDTKTDIITLVLVWSFGPDGVKGNKEGKFPDPKTGGKPADDLIVW